MKNAKMLTALVDFSAGMGERIIREKETFAVVDWKPLVEAGLARAATKEDAETFSTKEGQTQTFSDNDADLSGFEAKGEANEEVGDQSNDEAKEEATEEADDVQEGEEKEDKTTRTTKELKAETKSK